MTTFPNTKKRVENTKHSQGPKLTFFRQAPTGDRIFFFSRQMEKCGRQKVLVKLCKTQAKIVRRHGLAAKYIQSMYM